MIELLNVTKRYGRRAALEAVSLTVRPGEVTLLLGANGAGKSTLLRAVLGITDVEGTLAVAGLDPRRDGRAVRAHIGYMPQSGGLHPDLTVMETLRLYADIRRVSRDRCGALVREANLTAHAAVRVGELSAGLRQRLGFAVALLTDPGILILDEPAASLDRASREWLAAQLRRAAAEGRTVLVSTHGGQELLDAGERQILLEDGRVAADRLTQRERRADDLRVPGAAAAGSPRAATPGGGGPARVAPLIRKELRDAVGTGWLLGYAAVLGALGFAAALAGLDSASGLPLQAFGRTTATLMNLCLLLAPLVAVLMGAGAIAGEAERGTLEHLLAQPIGRPRLLLAKHAALLAALSVATAAGFLPAGILIAAAAGWGSIGHYLLFPAIAALAGAAMAGVGLLISVSSRSAVQAQGFAIFAWFAFVLLYDLLLMGSLAAGSLPVGALAAALFANPVDAARVLGVLALEPDLYLLGPAGAFITGRFTRAGAAALLLLALAAWAVLPVAAAIVRFNLPGAPGRRAARRAARPASSIEEVTLS